MESLFNFVAFVGWEMLLTCTIATISISWYIREFWMPVAANLPPGPPRIPAPFHLIPAIFSFGKGIKPFTSLMERYGDLVFIHIGSKPILLISTHDLVQDLIIKNADHTSARSPLPALDQVVNYGKGGIVFSSEDVWVQHRRFALKALRCMGMGKFSLEQKITEEANMLCAEIVAKCGQPFQPTDLLYLAVPNVISSIIFGHRFEYSDSEFKSVISKIAEVVNDELGLIADVPLWFFQKTKVKVEGIQDFIDKEIHQHEEDFDNNEPRDVIDMFLAELSSESDEWSCLKKDTFWSAIFDLFAAGSETTTTYISWILLILAGNYQIKKKVIEEVDAVVGQGRTPSYADRQEMPYFQAFLMEVIRFRPIAPLGLPHLITSDLTVRGYHVPRGTDIIMNIAHMHHDRDVWSDPEVFRPERFLGADGRTVLNRPELIPFGSGRRICLGEQLAKMETFLIVTTLVQRFTISLPEGSQPSYEPDNKSLIFGTRPYELILTER